MLRSLPDAKSDYFLSTPLSYRCNGDKGKAKWDKKLKVLSVTIPVRAPTKEEVEEISKAKEMEVGQIEVVGEEGAAEEGAAEEAGEVRRGGDGGKEGSAKEGSAKEVTKKAEDSSSSSSAVKKKEQEKPRESTREPFATDSPLPTNNAAADYKTAKGAAADDSVDDPRFRNLKASPQASPTAPNPAAEKRNANAVDVKGDFTASKEFDGKRTGYVFTTRSCGTGYYSAVAGKAEAAEKAAAKAQPAAKSSASPAQASPLKEKKPAALAPDQPQSTNYPDNDKFEYRQSPSTVTVLVQVPGIDGDAVSADFKETSVSLKYKTVANGADGADRKESKELKELKEFNLDLAEAVVPGECSFDVATKNMVIILKKKEANVVWGALEKAGEAGRKAEEEAAAAAAAAAEGGAAAKKAAASKGTESEGKKGGKGGGAAAKDAGSAVHESFSRKSSELMFDLD